MWASVSMIRCTCLCKIMCLCMCKHPKGCAWRRMPATIAAMASNMRRRLPPLRPRDINSSLRPALTAVKELFLKIKERAPWLDFFSSTSSFSDVDRLCVWVCVSVPCNTTLNNVCTPIYCSRSLWLTWRKCNSVWGIFCFSNLRFYTHATEIRAQLYMLIQQRVWVCRTVKRNLIPSGFHLKRLRV